MVFWGAQNVAMPDHVHAPGRPEDLPPPRVLWAHGALNALVSAALGEPTDTWLRRYWLTEDDGLGHDDSGGNWWNLERLPEGRAVLFGADHEMSETRWHKPPIDLVAGAPGWLDHDWFHANDDLVGYVYWFDAASWRRVPYPDDVTDDGLELTAGEYLTAERAVRRAAGELMGVPQATPIRVDVELDPAEEEGARVARAILAAGSERRLTEELLSELLNGLDRSLSYDEELGDVPPPFELDKAFDLARRAEFTPQSPSSVA